MSGQVKQRLLVSVRGPVEAQEAAKGGAHIIDVEYPVSALGTPYPLNIKAVRGKLRRAGYGHLPVATNIGEAQAVRASACQAALGVATAGADLIKFGLAEQTLESAVYLGRNLIRTVRELAASGREKKLYPAVFLDEAMSRYFKPFKHGPRLAEKCRADGLLIDTYDKLNGKGLLDYCTLEDIAVFAEAMHAMGKEAWIAGSITAEELPGLWETGVDVICVRGAACEPGSGRGRFGEVRVERVRELVATIPSN